MDFAQPTRLMQSACRLHLPNVRDLGAWGVLWKGDCARLLKSVGNSDAVQYFSDPCHKL